MNLSDHLAASLTSDMLALIRLVKADAEELGYPSISSAAPSGTYCLIPL